MGVLETSGRLAEDLHGLLDVADAGLAPLGQPESAERAPERARRSPASRQLDLLARELDRGVRLSERVMFERGQRAPGGIRDSRVGVAERRERPAELPLGVDPALGVVEETDGVPQVVDDVGGPEARLRARQIE